jgi:hypothetical protein
MKTHQGHLRDLSSDPGVSDPILKISSRATMWLWQRSSSKFLSAGLNQTR